MCGRYSIYDIELFQDMFNVKADFKPVYNAAPSMQLPIITNENPNTVTVAKWGLIPSWAKDEKLGYKMINARAETVSEKPAYKNAFQKQRCLVPADGYYEWKKTSSQKIPIRIQLKSKGLFSFAGIWEVWNNIVTFSIITTTPNEIMKPIHDRMPVILPKDKQKLWLEKPSIDLLKPYYSQEMEKYQITDKVNSPKNNNPDILKKVSTLDSF